MRKFLPTILLTSCALGAGLVGGSLATASSSAEAAILEASDDLEPSEIIAPAMGSDLFAGQTAACVDGDGVLYQIGVDQMQVGGEAIQLSSEQKQAFADAWRTATGEDAFVVSDVFGHVYFDETAGDWMVDVTEFDEAGCAASRTIMSSEQWNHLIASAASA